MHGNRTNYHNTARWAAMLLVSAWLLLPMAQPALADGVCTASAQAAFVACTHDVKDNFWEGRAICLNMSDEDESAECRMENREERAEALEECFDIRDARLELCEALGEDPYDPDFDPIDFDSDFNALTNPNDYLPIAIGNVWEYAGGGEMVTVEVMDKTKLIEGVTCIVVNDVVEIDGKLVEDTDDWLAQATDGAVHYCGEMVRDYEYFDGDDPEEAELVAIDGSFKAGREGAKSGILMMAVPMVGVTYRQEWSLGNAEDAAEVLSTTYHYGEDEDLDQFVPQELAELLCDGDCVVTRDFTPLEPGVEERKYYAPGIGMFLEVNVEEGGIVQLVDCSFNILCDSLPEPADEDGSVAPAAEDISRPTSITVDKWRP